ncbi:MAG: type III-A CRISPR-associated protein Csm2 [Pseudomonadota bacterium]
MRDIKSQLQNRGGTSETGGTKKCSKCGKPLKDPKFTLCFSCNQAERGANQNSTGGDRGLAHDYLEGGYFDEKNGKKYIKEAVYITWAQDVSAALRNQNMSPTAIRNFFNKLRAVEFKYKVNKDFDLAKQDLFAFCRDVKYTENRSVTPALFTIFIEKNIELAKVDSLHFKAFIEHFQSVIAYFKNK